MAKIKAVAKAKVKKVKATVSPAEKTVSLAALAAVGLTLGNDAVASTGQTVSPDSDTAELVDVKSSRDESSKGEKDQVKEESVEAVEREPSENGEVTADRAEGGKDASALADLEPVLLADASSALGVYSDQPLQFAQASTASSANTSAAGGGAAPGSAAAGAGAVAEGVAGTAASLGGVSGATALGAGAIAVGAVGIGGGGGAALAATAVTATAAPTVAAAGGLAAKGLLSNATVYYDFNGNGVFNADVDPFATTDAVGKYSINLTQAQKDQVATGLNNLGKELKLVVTGGTDITTGLAFTGTLSSVAPKDTAVEAKINVFTTMKAAGISDSVLNEMLGGRTLDSLGSSDFDTAGGPMEAIAVKLWNLVSDKVGGDADAAEAAMTAVGSILEKLNVAGGDLNALLGQGGSLDATELESLFGAAIDKSVALYDASVLSGEELTDEQLAAVMDDYAQALSTQLDEFTDGNVSTADLNAFNALQANANAAANTTSTNLGGTDAKLLAAAERYNAQIGYNSSGRAVSFILGEADAQLLLNQGVLDPFAAFSSGYVHYDSNVDAFLSTSFELILQVDGTLLGTADNPLTLAGLQALGVDGISDGTESGAPYLRFTEGNFTNVNSDLAFLYSIDLGASGLGLATGNLQGYVDGTTYNDNSTGFDNLGFIGIDVIGPGSISSSDLDILLGTYNLGH